MSIIKLISATTTAKPTAVDKKRKPRSYTEEDRNFDAESERQDKIRQQIYDIQDRQATIEDKIAFAEEDGNTKEQKRLEKLLLDLDKKKDKLKKSL